MSVEETDLRASLEAAMEPKEEVRAESQPQPEEPKPEPVKEEVETPAKQEVSPEPEKAEVKPDAEEKPKDEPKPVSSVKPPQSWKAGAKERWATLPPEVQEEVVRREREVTVAVQRNAEAAKFADQFQRTIAPYHAIIAAEGAANPLVAVQNMFQTATTLRLGTPVQKADLVARLIDIYGVDIQTLDNILSGQNAPEIKQQNEFDRRLAERLSPLEQKLAQYEQMIGSQQEQVQNQAKSAVEQFAETHEFVDDPDIANDMADLLEVAARRGRTLSMEDAYERAVQMHPTISKIVAQRKAAKTQTVDVQKIRDATSSVKGSPMGGGPPIAPEDIRGHIMAAMDRQI